MCLCFLGFGPPGSGKTYNTINRALEIVGVDTNGKSREVINGGYGYALFEEFQDIEEYRVDVDRHHVVPGLGGETLQAVLDLLEELVYSLLEQQIKVMLTVDL